MRSQKKHETEETKTNKRLDRLLIQIKEVKSNHDETDTPHTAIHTYIINVWTICDKNAKLLQKTAQFD